MSIAVRILSRRLRSLSDQNLRQYGDLSHVVEEAVQGYRVVKIFGAYGTAGRALPARRRAHARRGDAHDRHLGPDHPGHAGGRARSRCRS
jgi:ABC-type multidrug transport system fused ATPase/permease subunit